MPKVSSKFQQRFPGYHLKEILRQTQVGVWFRARQERIGRDVLIKATPQASSQRDERAQELLRKEVRYFGEKRHTGFLTLFDFHEDTNGCYAVFEYPAEGTLETLNKSNLPPSLLIHFLEQLVEILETLHQDGLFLNQALPRNFFIGDQNQIRLASLESVFHDSKEPQKELSPLWKSPVEFSKKGDLFLLGLLSLYLITQRVPVPTDILKQPQKGVDLLHNHFKSNLKGKNSFFGGSAESQNGIVTWVRQLLNAPKTSGDSLSETSLTTGLKIETQAAQGVSSNHPNLSLALSALIIGVLIGFGIWQVQSSSNENPGSNFLLRDGQKEKGKELVAKSDSTGSPAIGRGPALPRRRSPATPGVVDQGIEDPSLIESTDQSQAKDKLGEGVQGGGAAHSLEVVHGGPKSKKASSKEQDSNPDTHGPVDSTEVKRSKSGIRLIKAPLPPLPHEQYLIRARGYLGPLNLLKLTEEQRLELQQLEKQGQSLISDLIAASQKTNSSNQGDEKLNKGELAELFSEVVRVRSYLKFTTYVRSSFAGEVTQIEQGRVKVRYDFNSIRQREDWIPLGSQSRLIVVGGHLTIVGDVRFKPELSFEGEGRLSWEIAKSLHGVQKRNNIFYVVQPSSKPKGKSQFLTFAEGAFLSGGITRWAPQQSLLLPATVVFAGESDRAFPQISGVDTFLNKDRWRPLHILKKSVQAKKLKKAQSFQVQWDTSQLKWSFGKTKPTERELLVRPFGESFASLFLTTDPETVLAQHQNLALPQFASSSFQFGFESLGSTLEIDEVEFDLKLSTSTLKTLALKKAQEELWEQFPQLK